MMDERKVYILLYYKSAGGDCSERITELCDTIVDAGIRYKGLLMQQGVGGIEAYECTPLELGLVKKKQT